jgi:hypothetical protein
MRALTLIIVLFASATAACAQTIYFATFRGDNYAQKSWHTASLAAFKAAPPDDVYDSYTVEPRRDGSTIVQRDYSTPSGDWRFELTYEYGRDRRLRKVHSEFVTFGGITISGADEGLTRCIRDFTVSSRGTLQKTSERIIDEKTGRKVARQFYDPPVEHWMRLDDLPIPPKA